MFACTITACIKSQSKIPAKSFNECGDLDHLLQQVVNLILTVAKISPIYEVVGLLSPASIWSVELEVPQEVVGVLEVRSDCVQLVDQVLHTDDTVLA